MLYPYHNLAVKSPDAVAASVVVSGSTLIDQTAPLCPMNVPIQSPVSPFLICGSLSVNDEKEFSPRGICNI